MRETIKQVAAVVTVICGTVGGASLGLADASARTDERCESAVAGKRRRAAPTQQVSPQAASASTPAAAPVKANPMVLMAVLQSKVQVSRQANEMGFNVNLSPTRAITREEAKPFVSMMMQLQLNDANKVASDIADVQLHGHFDNVQEIFRVLATAYSSKLDPKRFATNLSQIKGSLLVPNMNEMGFMAQDLVQPNLDQSIQLFNILIGFKGEVRTTQTAILSVAEVLKTSNFDVIFEVFMEANQQKIPATQLAATVVQFAADFQLTRKVMGFGAASEIVRPSALESLSLVQLAAAMKVDSATMKQIVEDVREQTDATDFSTIIEMIAETLKPNKAAA